MASHRTSERGSALIYIFIGVALFGLLMFVYVRGGSQNTSNFTGQQNNISVSGLISESRSLESATLRLTAEGCSESELSFDPPPFTANTNPTAPVDFHCHVFHSSGGKLNFESFSADWKFSGDAAFQNAGTAAGELGAYLTGLDEATCQKINDLMKNGLTTIPSFAGTLYGAGFAGTFSASPTNFTTANNISAGCVNSSAHSGYVFFKSLIIR